MDRTKLYLQTDMEGVAGILNHDDWVMREGRYYSLGQKFLTLEVNAAIDGFFEAGVTEIIVADGHGAGGIDVELLDNRAKLMRGWPTGWPLLLDKTYDFVAFVGQHPKAGTEFGQICHTQWFNYVDLSINGVSIGELGQFAMCASELGVRTIFASGDLALSKEAKLLIPGIETVVVKEGTTPGSGDECNTQQYRLRNSAAVHLHPEKARELIRAGAYTAVKRALTEDFGIIELKAPFERIGIFRPDTNGPKTICRTSHPSSVIAALNAPFTPIPMEG